MLASDLARTIGDDTNPLYLNSNVAVPISIAVAVTITCNLRLRWSWLLVYSTSSKDELWPEKISIEFREDDSLVKCIHHIREGSF